MGVQVSVVNQTPYAWYYDNQERRGYTRVNPWDTLTYKDNREIHRYIYIKYEHHTWDSFKYEFNTHKGDSSFILRETFDRSQIQMHCTSEGGTHYCPNYGKIAEDEKQRQQEEEARRLERLEREQRIQQELDRESESSRQKLSRATERLREKQSFRGHQQHHERTQALHQQIDDDAVAIERNEVADVEGKFKELLLKYEITEDKEIQNHQVWDRIKTLQNELAIQYCKEKNLPLWSQFTFDDAVGYSELSLTEQLTVLEASLQFILHSNTEYAKDDGDQPLGWEKKYDFLFGLVEQLHTGNATLAELILLNVLDMISELSQQSKEILGQMLFNKIWTPTEIMLFICKSPAIKCDQLDSVLHTAQTYHLNCILVLSALRNENPLMFLQEQIKYDKEKDADTIVKELSDANCPEKVLLMLKDVLRYMESELPKCESVDLTKEQLNDLKKKIKSLNLANPEITILKDVLIGMSIAVQDCSTIITKDNKKIQGYFPRRTQLASLLLLLLAQLTENKGCLLEIGTGEGKSCILAMFATILAIRGTKVDIVTSSPVLAQRDQEDWKKFFEMFGVTSSVVPPRYSSAQSPEEQEELLRNAYRQQIVYGTVGVFAADILKQEFEKRTTRDTRPFELVIVDEVDYMTLDNGVQVTFLSHESGGFRHVEQVLSNIWAMISSCQPIEIFETGEIKWATRIQYFHKAATSAIMGLETSDNFSANEILLPGVTLGFYNEEDVEMINQAQSKKENEADDAMSEALSKIMKKLGITQQFDLLSIFEEVLENSAVFKCYSLENKKAKRFDARKKQGNINVEMLLLEGGLACEIMSEKSLIDATVSTIQSSIRYSNNLPTAKEDNNFLVIPGFLKNYVENQLPVFVENALKAVQMLRGREYMIDASSASERDTTASNDKHVYNAVIPVDFKASGVLEKNKKWGNGLQQFLEFKHQLAISPISNVTNYMSNFHFFKRYLSGSGIFGVSGTLGGKADWDFLERHYKAKSYNVPEHRHKRMVELPVIEVKGGNHQWIQTICETTWKVAERGQVVLVICEDVKTADELHGKMQVGGRVKAEQITLYTISEKHNIEREKFCGGRIIIATNLGGRGTDIKVDESVNKQGGLFVLLSHFPDNRRVEKQIFGRTSRKGNPGMVQIVVNCDHLAPAYQGQAVEIMRELREHYETKRILDMESDELVEINLKENLFSTFCRLLKDFDGQFTQTEKLNPMRMQLENIPDCFKCHQTKLDYQPAINALKESWALWLTLHEDHINRHDDFSQLEADLIKTIKGTSEKLLQGQSDNFYDHIRQAIVRTDLHCRNKSSNSNGAESYWQKVVNSDPHYKAVALYNQAYITINLGKGDYKADAMKLLGDAKKSIDVYISEVSNTMISCNLSVTGNKDHSTDHNNFQNQMEARMNIFSCWMKYVDNAMLKLKELEKSKDDAITEECSVYMLSEEKNFIITNELMSLYDYGLGIVFEVKKKPKFCIDALICFILGVVQVLAGILICVFTAGTASQFGMGLISEGVSDMISGIEGMVKGTFDWVSWAISKSISIGLALITAGFSAIKKAVTAVYKVTKSLLNGTKSFSSVASEFIKSGKAAFTSFKGSIKSGLSSVGKQSFKSAMKNMTTSAALKQNFKHAAKYAVQEIGKKSVITAMNYAIDAALQELFKSILQNSFKNVVTSSVKQNSKLDQTLVEFISSGVPKAALKKENFKIDSKYEKQIKESVGLLSEEIIPELILDCTKAQDVISKLSEVCDAATELMEKAKLSGVLETAKLVLKVAECSTRLCQILGAVPTKEIIDQKFVPQFLQSINELQTEMTKYDQDGRHKLNDVQRLKGELLQEIAQKVSDKFISSCSDHMTSLMTSTFKSQLTSTTGEAVDKVMRRQKTQRFFDDQREKHNKKSASHKEVQQLSDEDKTKLKQYTEDMCKADRPTTALDVYVLTKTNLLEGKGIRLTIVDENGKQLTEERHPGTNKSAGDIKLRLTKSAKDQHALQAGSQLYSGRFDIMQDDGKISKVNSDDQNALYHAVVQATSSETKEPSTKALMLREKVKNEIQTNLELYTPQIVLQRGYDLSHKTPKKYSLSRGSKTETNSALQEYLKSVQFIKSDERIIIKMYHLGFVGEYTSVVSARMSSVRTTGTLSTSHIPPKDSLRLAQTFLENPQSAGKLQNKDLELYKLISRIKSDNNGKNLIAMEVLGQDHIQALTTGPSSRSQVARKLLSDTMISGDAELLLKHCMILHHPLTSQKLRSALGENIQSSYTVLSDDGIRGYYKAGYRNLVSEYSRIGILDQNQRERLVKWVSQDQHEETNTAEYSQVLEGLKKEELK